MAELWDKSRAKINVGLSCGATKLNNEPPMRSYAPVLILNKRNAGKSELYTIGIVVELREIKGLLSSINCLYNDAQKTHFETKDK